MLRLVLVDDNDQFRTVLRRLLERDSAIRVVGEAASGARALDVCAEERPDVVLMDVSMPELDGLQATRRLKALDPAPVVLLLSVANKAQEVAAGLAQGASEYLGKDTPAAEIVAAVKRHGPVATQQNAV